MTHRLSVLEIMENVRNGVLEPSVAAEMISSSSADVCGVACLDLERNIRCGVPEIVLAEGKDLKSLVAIMHKYVSSAGRCVASRVTPEQAAAVCQDLPPGVSAEYREICGILILSDGSGRGPTPSGGTVAVVTAGTSDIRVAEEVRAVAEETGARVLTAYDVGVAGIHRLFPALDLLKEADVYVVCAGREGTLPSVVAGLVDKPVIGVPVSTGYGYMGNGEAALASMLQSCAVIAVVNIDAGFSAGAFAGRVAAIAGGGGR